MSPAKVKAPTAATVEALNVNTPPIKEGFNMSDSKAVQASIFARGCLLRASGSMAPSNNGGAMRKSLKVSRGLQLLGGAILVMGIVSCSVRGDPQAMSLSFIAGFLLVVGARIYEWLSKE